MPVFGINCVFAQSLPDALHHAAMHLTRKQHRVHHNAKIVDDGITLDFGVAGLGVNLDLANMRAIWVSGFILLKFASGGQVLRRFRGTGDVGEGNAAIRTNNAGNAVDEFNIMAARFQFVGGNGFDLFSQRRPSPARRYAAQRYRARAAGAAASGEFVGVALAYVDLGNIDIEFLSNKLRIGRGMALPVALCADAHFHDAVAAQNRNRRLGTGKGAGLDIGCHADPAQLASGLGTGRPFVKR